MTNHTVAVIQARMGSTRFPGKMMEPFRGRPILSWVIKRLQRSELVDELILATTDLSRDQVLVELANDHGIQTFAGDEQNVLDRFVKAAEITSADTVVRVCADNPLVAPEAVDQLIAFFNKNRPDYAYNHVPKGSCTHPDGFGAEILSAELLKSIARNASRNEHLEHVTSYVWDHRKEFSIGCPPCPKTWHLDEDARFDVDQVSDLALLEHNLKDIRIDSSIEDILACWRLTRNKAHA